MCTAPCHVGPQFQFILKTTKKPLMHTGPLILLVTWKYTTEPCHNQLFIQLVLKQTVASRCWSTLVLNKNKKKGGWEKDKGTLWQAWLHKFTTMVVAFSSHARILEEFSTIHSLLALFFFKVEISSRTLIPPFKPGSAHSDSASSDDCERVFPDE